MLIIPTRGFSQREVEIGALCDWLEASLLFTEERVSQAQVVNYLCEDGIFDEQGEANRLVADGWSELRRRLKWQVGASFYKIEGHVLKKIDNWQDWPAEAFCLLATMSRWHPEWVRQQKRDYSKQGELFEKLTEESVASQLLGWKVLRTGWSSSQPNHLPKVIQQVADFLGEPVGFSQRWTRKKAKDEGLDIVCVLPFPDNRSGVPVFLLQCASGNDWKTKLQSPDIALWMKLIDFAVEPRRAFATPYAVHDSDFRHSCLKNNGLFIDRHRLLAASRIRKDWVSPGLARELLGWVKPQVKSLPMREGY